MMYNQIKTKENKEKPKNSGFKTAKKIRRSTNV